MTKWDKYGRIENPDYKDDIISAIGHWFEGNDETISGCVVFIMFVIGAIRLVVDVVRTFRDGHPFSAIFSALFGVFMLGLSVFVTYLACKLVCYVGQLVFKNAICFTMAVLIALGIFYLSSHPRERGDICDGIRYRKAVIRCGNCGAQFNVLFRRIELNPARYCPCPRCNAPTDVKLSQLK